VEPIPRSLTPAKSSWKLRPTWRKSPVKVAKPLVL